MVGPILAAIATLALTPTAEGTSADASGPRLRNPARPHTAQRRDRLVYDNLTGYRYNPLGLLNQLRIGWRRRLYRRPGTLFDNHLDAKLHTFVTPAFTRAGPMIEIQPLAVLRVSASYTVYGVYGTFGMLHSYDSPRADHGPAVRRAATQRDENYATVGQQAELTATLRAEIGPVAFRSTATFQYAKLDLHDGDTVFYDRAVDLLQPNGGWAVTNDTDLLLRFDNGFMLAARYSLGRAFYRDHMYRPGEPTTDPNGTTQRLGPAVLFRLWRRPGARVDEPTVAVLTQWWLRHRYRTGAAVSQAIPYLAVAFLFRGDLLR